MLSPGTRLGPYEVVSSLGAGGMGEVYRARDTRLDRDVAIKVLPAGFASDAAARERFDREARSIAALNHPHICTLHDVGRHGETEFLVMELLEGQTLAERLAKGPLPLAQALTIAREIADALDKAHRHGIVHRDLKPGNIILVRSGAASSPPIAKLLDFGLAKPARSPLTGAVQAAATATARPMMTAEGSIVGTLHYMAPEQLEGREADARSDLWALGCVLYEMLASVRPFEGKTGVSLMAAILEHEPPPLRDRQPITPPALEHVVARCLAKDPDDRWQSARDVLGELEWIARGEAPAPAAAAPVRPRLSCWLLPLAAAAAGAAAVAVAQSWRPASAGVPPPAVQFEITAEGGPQSQFTLSPDGRYLATIAPGGTGQARVWLRALRDAIAQRVLDTPTFSWWAWTPDSSALLIGIPGGLQRIDVRSGAALHRPGKWPGAGAPRIVLADGRFVLGRMGGVVFPLQLWTEAGQQGDATVVHPEAGESRHVFPAPIGDDGFTFMQERTDGSNFVCVARVGAPHRCDGPTNHDDYAWYSSGRLLYRRSGALITRPFDVDAGQFTGDEQSIPIGADGNQGTTWVSASQTGVVAFGVASLTDQLSWFDRTGQQGPIATVPRVQNFSLSPDGTRVLLQQRGGLFLRDLAGGGTTRLGPSLGDPVWSPDGRRLAHRTRAGVVVRSVDDPTETVVYKPTTGFSAFPESWSPDGHTIVAVLSEQPFGGVLIPLHGGSPQTILPASDGLARADEFAFSPDGRWLAFNAESGGRFEVFVVPNPPSGPRWQVSTNGGMQARWGTKGELYYLEPDGTMVEVTIAPGATFTPDRARPLFKIGFAPASTADSYHVAADGRFLVKMFGGAAREIARVIVNWPSLVHP